MSGELEDIRRQAKDDWAYFSDFEFVEDVRKWYDNVLADALLQEVTDKWKEKINEY